MTGARWLLLHRAAIGAHPHADGGGRPARLARKTLWELGAGRASSSLSAAGRC
jgi:hypothetical protein